MNTKLPSDLYARLQTARPQINKFLIYVGAICGAVYCAVLGFHESQWGGMIFGSIAGAPYGALIGFIFPKVFSFIWAFFLTSILVFLGVFILIHVLSLIH